MINKLIHYVNDMGLRQVVYDSAFPVIIVTLLIFFPLYGRKYALPWWKAVITCAITILGVSRMNGILGWAVNGFKADAGANILYVFVYFPLLCILVAKLLKVKVGVMLDYMGPSIVLWHMIGQSVCPFFGCCEGIPCSWGIWNPQSGEMVVPVQWMISLSALLVFLFMLHYAKKRQYDGSGRIYPIMLMMLGGMRFFLEFLKDASKILPGLTELSLHALFMVLVGTVWYLTLEEIRLEKERTANVKKRYKLAKNYHTYKP